MAIEIKTKFTVDLSTVVNNSITTVRAIRRREQARKESEFQKAIANGLSYEEQIKLRETQLAEEKKSSLSSDVYIASLEKSITETKRLNRFNKYRIRYAETLGELSSGKINEEQYLSILQSQLNGVVDPNLRLEIQGDITAAHAKLKTYNDTILSNQVKKAKFDGTTKSLNGVISQVNAARAQALIDDSQDEVTAYDETLASLQAQISTVRVQDSITDFQVKSSTRGTDAVEKLNYINTQMQGADANTAIKIGERTFSSAQQFWSLERDNFLAGNSEIFGNFFEELNVSVKNSISVNASKFGYPTQIVLDSAMLTFNNLRAKPEMTPFLNRVDITQAAVMSDAVDKLAKKIINIGTNNLTFREADIQLKTITTKYNVDTSSYRLQLDEQLRSLVRGGVIDVSEAKKMAPDVEIPLPRIDKAPPTPATPTAPGVVTPVDTGVRVVKAGDTLGAIAVEAGISLSKLLELNPQFQADPNLIRPGESVNLPGLEETPAPVVPPTPKTPEITPPAPTPTPVSTPTPAPTSAYTGSSIVDYLKSIGQDSSTQSRARLAVEKGIVKSEDEYLDSAKAGANAILNTNLLDALRKE